MKGIVKLVIFIAVVAGLWWGWTKWKDSKGLQVEYATATVGKEDILITIDATGTIEPEELVDVGAQVGGRILAFGTDTEGRTVDYASYVKQGQMLARIDDVLVLSDIARAKAGVAQAEASIEKAKADILQSEARYKKAESDRDRAVKLGPGEALARAAYDQYIFEEASAKASVEAAKASLQQAIATRDSNQATLEKEERNLGYTVIESPVDGVVINRIVNIGQTVVSSMNAPSLFLIAKDLKKIQIWSAVNEADIGRIYRGQRVIFKVDAFPEREFEGTVNKIRLNATMTSNVVTYVVEVDADNPERILLPYLTADVKFIVHDLKGTLVVPNSATRFIPDEDMIVPSELDAFKKKYADTFAEQNMSRESRLMVIWQREGAHVRPVWVTAGESNGTVTPVKPNEGYELAEGAEIVVSADRLDGKKAEANENKNPFMPNMPRRGRRR